MLDTEAGREKWTVRIAFAALPISLVALLFTGLQWRSAERAANIANQARIDASRASSDALAVAEQGRKDAVTAAERQRIDAQTALDRQRRDAAAALEAQTKRADRANELADRSAKAAEDTSKTAALQVEVTGRPWVKFKPRILSVAFNSNFFRVESAVVNIEDTFENVGPTVALNVTSWEDVFPLDATFHRSAIARQKEMCDANRHLAPTGVTGYSLFPKDPFILHSIVGPPMKLVTQAVVKTSEGDRVGFVLVGCVSYRAPFEAVDAPRHQTRYVYLLGRTGADGNFNTYIEPTGTITDLGVISVPDGFSAD